MLVLSMCRQTITSHGAQGEGANCLKQSLFLAAQTRRSGTWNRRSEVCPVRATGREEKVLLKRPAGITAACVRDLK